MEITPPAQPPLRVFIHDLRDEELAADTRQAVYDAFEQYGPSTEPSIVSIAAGQTRGRWDVEVRGAASKTCFSFTASAPLVPQFVRHYLTIHLARLTHGDRDTTV